MWNKLFIRLTITLGVCILPSAPLHAEGSGFFSFLSGNTKSKESDSQQHHASDKNHQLKLSHDLTATEKIITEPLIAGITPADLEMAKADARKRFSKSWQLISKRSQYVRHRILATLASESAPLSLQAIPVVESTYSPYALSHAGATGLWQLMPATAKSLGIKPERKFDGRRDINRSTRAAIKYLKSLHDRFDSWPLAIASYNLGPNAVSRRLKKSPWEISDGLDNMPVPTGTRNYVKHIIGLVCLLNEGELVFPEAIKTEPLQLNPPIDIHLLANLSGIEKDEIFRFNPSLNQAQYLTHPVTIHVPTEHHAKATENIAYSGPKFVYATVKKGNSMWSIARKHGTSVKTVKELNRGISNILRIGQKLKVPANQLAKASANLNPLLASNRRIRYKVRSGDSLWRIANRFGTTVKAIARVNSLSHKSVIRAGDTLWVLARIRPS